MFFRSPAGRRKNQTPEEIWPLPAAGKGTFAARVTARLARAVLGLTRTGGGNMANESDSRGLQDSDGQLSQRQRDKDSARTTNDPIRSPLRFEPGGEQILNQLAELPTPQFPKEREFDLVVSVLPDVGSNLFEIRISTLPWRASPNPAACVSL